MRNEEREMNTVKFKDSPLGPIPQDWEVKRLGDLCSITTGHKDVNEGSELGLYPFFTCSRNVYRANSYSFDGEAILIAGNGEVGNLHYYDGKFEAYQRTYVLMDFSVNVAFLRQYLSAFLMRELMDDKTGSSMPYIVLSALSNCPIPYPSEEEQQRIAEALGGVDKLIESLDEQIEKKRLIAKGVAHDLLSGKKRLPGFKGAWRCANLGTLVDFITDTIATKDIDTRKYVSTDNMLSNLAGVTPNKSIVPYASVREFKSGDILLSNIRPYLKKMWFADYDAGCSTDVLVLRVVADLIDSRFLYRVLARDTFFEFVSAKAVGTKMPRGDKRVIAVFQVPIPQLAEQQAIADLLGEQDAAIAVLEEKREKYARIKEGMMRDLLTGKVRMKGE